MKFLQTTFYSLFVNSISALCLIVINKVFSIYLGVTGIALIGQMSNFIDSISTAARIGMGKSMVVLIAKEEESRKRAHSLFNGLILGIINSAILGSIIFLFSKDISYLIFQTEGYANIITIFSVTLVLNVFNNIALGYLNGSKQISYFLTLKVLQSLVSLGIGIYATVYYGLFGGILSLVINQTLVFLFASHATFSSIIKYRSGLNFDRKILKRFLVFGGLIMLVNLWKPTELFLIRYFIINSNGLELAGYWSSMMFLAAKIQVFIIATVSVFLLPDFSSIKTKNEKQDSLMKRLFQISCLSLIFLFAIYQLRDFIIQLFYTEDFLYISDYMWKQFIAEFFKLVSAVLILFFLSEEKIKPLFFFNGFGVLISYLLISSANLLSLDYIMNIYIFKNIVIFILLMSYFFILKNDAK